MEALEEPNVESRKIQKYLPDFLEKLREDLGKELRGEREHELKRVPGTIDSHYPGIMDVACA
jgi:hypothetical protein